MKVDVLCERQLVGQERPLGVDDGQVVDEADLVLDLREAEIILRCGVHGLPITHQDQPNATQ
jgi:hypothetical protein